MQGSKTVLLFFILSSLVFSGCRENRNRPRLIEQVLFNVSPNLEFISLSLQFTQSIRSNLQGDFPIKNYGNLFVSPWTSTSPFELGFRLNTEIFNEQDYINIDPTNVLPNGMNLPDPIDRALIQLSGTTPIHPQFDLFGYVDVLGKEWMGAALIFGFIDQSFPSSVVIHQYFFLDTYGNPGAIASVFGPTVENGVLKRPGGIALFGNASRLIQTKSRALTAAEDVMRERVSQEFNNNIYRYYRERNSQSR